MALLMYVEDYEPNIYLLQIPYAYLVTIVSTLSSLRYSKYVEDKQHAAKKDQVQMRRFSIVKFSTVFGIKIQNFLLEISCDSTS